MPSFYETDKCRAMTEAALIARTWNEQQSLTTRGLGNHMSDWGKNYVRQLSAGFDYSHMDTFTDILYFHRVVEYDIKADTIRIGRFGQYLTERFIEQWEAPVST